MFNGKKTYVAAGATILGSLAGLLSGAVALPDAVQLIVTAVLGATIRHGVSSEVQK